MEGTAMSTFFYILEVLIILALYALLWGACYGLISSIIEEQMSSETKKHSYKAIASKLCLAMYATFVVISIASLS
jgi:hypothetical protein